MPCQGGLSLIQESLPLPFYQPIKSLLATFYSGFQDGGEERSSPGKQDLFAYPWDKSRLKSMAIELQQFKKLVAYVKEVSATSSVESLVSVLLQKAHSDLEKVRAIWMWICHHIGFQDGGEERSSPGKQDLFAYPWDKSRLKSMAIELQQFKKLVAYVKEVSATSSVESLVSVLLQKAHSDLEKVRAIWMWICHHIGFQDGGEERSSPGKQDLFAYPWDKSRLKSMAIELQQFEKLDAYAKEVSATSSVESLVSVLLQKAHSDLEKVRAIWMWICHHIEYNGTNTSSEPADVLQSGKSVCAGYAALFEKMCSIAGIGCKYLTGYAKGYSYKEGKIVKDKSHAWNAVYLDGRWHLVDCTWGSGFVENGKFTFSHNEFYFLTHPAILINSHFPKDSKWQLLEPTLSEQEFAHAERLTPSFFSKQLVTASPGTSVIKTDKVNKKI